MRSVRSGEAGVQNHIRVFDDYCHRPGYTSFVPIMFPVPTRTSPMPWQQTRRDLAQCSKAEWRSRRAAGLGCHEVRLAQSFSSSRTLAATAAAPCIPGTLVNAWRGGGTLAGGQRFWAGRRTCNLCRRARVAHAQAGHSRVGAPFLTFRTTSHLIAWKGCGQMVEPGSRCNPAPAVTECPCESRSWISCRRAGRTACDDGRKLARNTQSQRGPDDVQAGAPSAGRPSTASLRRPSGISSW